MALWKLAGAFTILARNSKTGEELATLLGQPKDAFTFIPLAGAAVTLDSDATIVRERDFAELDEAEREAAIQSRRLLRRWSSATWLIALLRHTWLTRQAADGAKMRGWTFPFTYSKRHLAFQKWTEVKPDTNWMREAAEEFLGI